MEPGEIAKGFKSFYDCLRSEETEVTDLNGGQWPVTVVDVFCELLASFGVYVYHIIC
jgi:hypothetical protein